MKDNFLTSGLWEKVKDYMGNDTIYTWIDLYNKKDGKVNVSVDNFAYFLETIYQKGRQSGMQDTLKEVDKFNETMAGDENKEVKK